MCDMPSCYAIFIEKNWNKMFSKYIFLYDSIKSSNLNCKFEFIILKKY